MASPLNYFRKHQGYILAVLGVILIVTWVIGPSLQGLFETAPSQGSAENGDEVVARYQNGTFTRTELNRMQWEHQAAVSFLLGVVRRALEEGATPQAPFLNIQQDRILDLGIETGSSDEALVDIELLAEKGREFGVRVDEGMVLEYLKNLGGYHLTEDQLYQIARETLSQRRDPDTRLQLVTVAQLFDRLKVELAARQALEMYRSGIDGLSTGELWEYHNRLHRRYKIEAYPLDVAAFKDQVQGKKAKEEELKQIYEEGREQVPNPDFYEPGFRKPLRLAFGYVKADFQTFLNSAKKTITEEQIVAEYEKQISAGNFRRLKLDSPAPGTATPPDDAQQPEDAQQPAGQKEPQTPAAEGAAKEGSKEKEGSPAKEGTQKKVDGDRPADPAAEKSKAEPAETDPRPAEVESKTKNGDPTASAEEKSCQDEPSTEAKQPADDAPPATRQDSPDKQNAKEEPVKNEPTADDKSADEPPTDKPPTDKPSENGSPGAPAEPEVKPLSEVREEILQSLAMPAATAAMEAALNAANRAVQDYGVKYTRWIESKKAGGKIPVKDPGELKIKALAEKHRLTYAEVPLLDRFEVASTELGSQAVVAGPQGNAVSFPEGAYGEQRPLYAPQQAFSRVDEGRYVFWRTDREESVVVPYEQARKQVLAAWVKQQAVAAARKQAEAIAAKAEKAPSLKAALSEEQAKKVLEPLPFSWLSRSGQPIAFGGAPRLSDVSGIPLAGQEFMQAVFDLDVGEAGVAVNQAHTTVYVVRVVADEPALDIRREMFVSSLQAGLFGDLVQYGLMARRRLMAEVMEELRKEYEFQWIGTPRLDGELEM